MEGVPTLLNVADMGTKRLTKVRRAFLMYLMGMVQYDESSDSYVAVGEWEFPEELRRRTMAKNMKAVKQVMLNTLMDITEGGSLPISTNLVKLVTLMAMQPVATGFEMDNVEVKLIEARSSYFEVFNVYPLFLVAYAVLFVFIGFVAGYYFNKFVYNERVRRVLKWTSHEVRRLRRLPMVVDDWDPLNQELRQFRVHERPQDADCGEEYFRETPNGLARYVRPHHQARLRLGVEELDRLEAMQMEEPSENSQSENAETDAEVQTEISMVNNPIFQVARRPEVAPRPVAAPIPIPQRREPPQQVPEEHFSLPGSPRSEKSDDLPDLPMVGLDMHNIDVLLVHFPPS